MTNGEFRTDITEQKQLENQLEQPQLEAMEQFADSIAHDLNNLLTVITGYSELLLNDRHLTEPARLKVQEIRKAGIRASLLTQQLLHLSRKQSKY